MRRLPSRYRRPLLVLAGSLAALPHILPAFAPAAWLLPAVLFLLLQNASCDSGNDLFRGFFDAFFYFFAYHAVICHWFLWMDPAGLSGISGAEIVLVRLMGFLLLPALYAALFALAAPAFLWLRRWSCGRLDAWLLPVMPLFWTCCEWVQTTGWLGLPLGRFAAGQAFFLPAVQSASLFGSLFVSFLMWITAAFAAFAFDHEKSRGKRWAAFAAAVLVFFGNLGFGWIRLGTQDVPGSGETVTAAAIQGNISSAEKWGEMRYDEMLVRYLDLCGSALDQGAKLVVLPETALPAYYNEQPERLAPFSALAERYGADILLGGFFRRMDQGETPVKQNAVYRIDPEGGTNHQPYFKRMLVPFGEYVPMRSFFSAVCPPLSRLNMTGEDWTAGTGSYVFSCAAGEVGALVCFDSQYEELARASVRDGARILAVCTNDSWFDGTGALNEHLAQSVLRAVETGCPVVRSANTGISAIIGPDGKILDRTAAGVADLAIAGVEVRSGTTLYDRIGDAWLLAGVCYLFLLSGWIGFRRVRKKAAKTDCPRS